MSKRLPTLALAVVLLLPLGGAARAQQAPAQPAAQPSYETKKVADGVYVFRYQGAQAMFVVTRDGVIATDPMSPAAARVYVEEIRKVTPAPIRYVVYSHHHFDHIAGGAPFKQAGAIFVSHFRARARLERLANPDVVIPDLTVENGATLTLGGTTMELRYVGANHTDDTLVMLLPKEKVLFAVDFLPIREIPFRNMPDSNVREWFTSIDRVLEMDWTTMIAGHPRQGGIGSKDDVRNLKMYLTDLRAAVKKAADEGKCFDKAMEEVTLPKYESWGRYKEFLPGNVERFCFYWRNGWE